MINVGFVFLVVVFVGYQEASQGQVFWRGKVKADLGLGSGDPQYSKVYYIILRGPPVLKVSYIILR